MANKRIRARRRRNRLKRRISDILSWHQPDYYDDGVITWKASNKKDSVWERIFNRLEDDLGIQTKRVRGRTRAGVDIVCRWGDADGWAGLHSRNRRNNGREYSEVTVEWGNWYSQSTAVHEIGHALGLDHPSDHSRTDTIMSYGAPGDLPWFTALDRAALNYLY